jgi:colanic acid/amylovoran biosynthesis glycosyltransferase
MACLKSCGALKVPLVVSLHGFDISRHQVKREDRYSNLFRYADRILVTTDFMANQALAFGCPDIKLLRLPIGIRLEQFTFRERQWRPGSVLHLLSVSRLVEKKGIEYGLRAVAELVADGLDVHYTVIGDGPLRGHLEQLAASLGIGRRALFVGALGREGVLAELDKCHLFLLPSVTAEDGDSEGQGMVLQEAQACGIPAVATRHGGLPEGCIENVTAKLVPERDAPALAGAVRELIEQRDQWPAMGYAGRDLIEKRYQICTQISALDKLYRSLL